MSSKISKWIKDLDTKSVITYFVFGLILFVFIKLMIGGIFGFSLVVIQNGPHSSMWPTYDQGDMFLLSHVKPEKIHLGDVIVYESDNYATRGMLIIHRVVNIVKVDTNSGTKYYYQVSGDNPVTNNVIDVYNSSGTLIPYEAIKGKTIFLIPKVGYLRIWYQEQVFFRIIFIGVLVALAIYILFYPEDKEEKNKKQTDSTEEKEQAEANDEKETNKENVDSDSNDINDGKTDLLSRLTSYFRKLFTDKKKRNKILVVAGLIILLIIMIPVIDTLIADHSLETGIHDINFLGAYQIRGNETTDFIFVSFTINFQHDGSWNEVLKSFTVYGIQNGQTLATMKWYSFYQKEGNLTIGGSLIFKPQAFNYSLPLTIQIHYTIKYRFGHDQSFIYEETFDIA